MNKAKARAEVTTLEHVSVTFSQMNKDTSGNLHLAGQNVVAPLVGFRPHPSNEDCQSSTKDHHRRFLYC
jgi:hypothetical protein